MKLKTILASIVGAAVVTATAAYWWYSPYLELQSLQAAVKANDTVAFNEHVDYDKLKESLTQQLTTALMPVADKQMEAKGKSPMVAAGAQLGTSLGLMLIGPMVNSLVTPDVLMKAMQSGSFKGPKQADASASTPEASQVKWTVERKSANTVVVHDDGDKPLTLIFTRSGFAAWKWSGVELPPGVLNS